ncbi:hypothetical protein [Halomonas salinarum]|uniref:hypothetical protein n=1 Tax=Halomonas salinarum TaxID=1158993 RepID=UPI00143A5017|nr:hypothetical protein [Halomonas salinarum]
MTRKLHPVVIRNPRRRGLVFRLRDALLVTATLGLWGAVIGQSILLMTDEALALQHVYLLHALKLLAINFAVVFIMLHGWVLYESLRARKQPKGVMQCPDAQPAGLPRRLVQRTYPHLLSCRSGWFVTIIFLTDILT